eukprot:TRINITY_DN8294_c0_g1_i1.p1 TRINITY_DN8294_c0_g1~~TRINITY_DN8294_c0_g1_i1.p1  ORF type:complete len:453 (+),score=105.23 TRINITY_DN8294_c0_g1_i1:110-1468(+)
MNYSSNNLESNSFQWETLGSRVDNPLQNELNSDKSQIHLNERISEYDLDYPLYDGVEDFPTNFGSFSNEFNMFNMEPLNSRNSPTPINSEVNLKRKIEESESLEDWKRRYQETTSTINRLQEEVTKVKKEAAEKEEEVARMKEEAERTKEEFALLAGNDPKIAGQKGFMARCQAIEVSLLLEGVPKRSYTLRQVERQIVDITDGTIIFDADQHDTLLILGQDTHSLVEFLDTKKTDKTVRTRFFLNLRHHQLWENIRVTLFRLKDLPTFALFFEKNPTYTVGRSINRKDILQQTDLERMYYARFYEIEKDPERFKTNFHHFFAEKFGLSPQEYIWNYFIPGSINIIFTVFLPHKKMAIFEEKMKQIDSDLKAGNVLLQGAWKLDVLNQLEEDQFLVEDEDGNHTLQERLFELKINNSIIEEKKEEIEQESSLDDSFVSQICGSSCVTPKKTK